MKTFFSVLVAAVTAAAFTNTAVAQPAAGGLGRGSGAHPMDCAAAKDRTRCETLNKDIAACKDKIGDEWLECMHRPASAAKITSPKPRDCAKARSKERCEAHNTALDACKDKTTRAQHRKCMAGQLSVPSKR